MKRRDFHSRAGAAAAATWLGVFGRPTQAQPARVPLIGFLNGGSPAPFVHRVAGFRENPRYANAAAQLADLKEGARRLGVGIVTQSASQESELEPAFAALARQRIDGLVVGSDPFFNTRVATDSSHWQRATVWRRSTSSSKSRAPAG